MTQGKFGFKRPVPAKPIKKLSRDFDRQNLATAKLFLSEPEQHQGFGLIWAKAVVARIGGKAA